MSTAERLLGAVLQEWELRADGPVVEGRRASVAVVTADGAAALLEHAPDGSASEHLALRAWDGAGAVRLLRADPRRHLLLTERTEPGRDLTGLGHWEACTEVGSLFGRLHRAPIPQPPRLADLAERWLADLDHPDVAAVVPRRFASQVRSWTPGLVDETAGPAVLLHGDLRPGTVRAGVRQAWLAVAPRPAVGDAAYEVAPSVNVPWAGAAASTDLRGDLLERFYAVVDAAGLDEDRSRAWVVVRTLADLAARFVDGRGTPDDVTWAMTVVKAVQR